MVSVCLDPLGEDKQVYRFAAVVSVRNADQPARLEERHFCEAFPTVLFKGLLRDFREEVSELWYCP